MTAFLLITLPVFLIVFFFAAMFWRSYQTWKATGVNPYKLGGTDSAHDYNGFLFRAVLVMCALVVGIYSFAPALYLYLAPIQWLEQPFLVGIGLALLAVALIWILIAQAQMGAAWRIGIDEIVKTPLVEEGLFSRSRNPIFLGMRILLTGFFFVIPNAVTFAIWIVGETLMQIQVRLEEAHLRHLHGDMYGAYFKRVRRWL